MLINAMEKNKAGNGNGKQGGVVQFSIEQSNQGSPTDEVTLAKT